MLRIYGVMFGIGIVALGACSSQPEAVPDDGVTTGSQSNMDAIKAGITARARAHGANNDASTEMMCTTFKPGLCGQNPGRWDFVKQKCDCSGAGASGGGLGGGTTLPGAAR